MCQSVVRFVKPNDDLLYYIISNMRGADIDEVAASSTDTVEQAVLQSVKNSKFASVVVIDDKPCMVFGVVNNSVLSNSGIPWALGTNGVVVNYRLFARESKKVLSAVMSQYSSLSNYVHADNILSIKWLKWMGFNIDIAQPTGINGEMFHRFHLER